MHFSIFAERKSILKFQKSPEAVDLSAYHSVGSNTISEKLFLPFLEWGGAGVGGVPAAVGMACQQL
jgi:hypothetical protein